MGKKLYELNSDELKQKKKQWKIISYILALFGLLFLMGSFYLYIKSFPLLGIYIFMGSVINYMGYYFLDNSCEHLDILICIKENKNYG